MAQAVSEKNAPKDEALKRMEEARQELRRIMEGLAPLRKHKKLKRVSTDGTWRDTSSLNP